MRDLEDTFCESGLLRQFLQVLGVWVVVECEVGFHRAQLMMFERCSQSLLSPTPIAVSAILDASVCTAVPQHVQITADNIAETDVTCP